MQTSRLGVAEVTAMAELLARLPWWIRIRRCEPRRARGFRPLLLAAME